MGTEKWLREPVERDFTSASDFLSLLVSQRSADATVAALRKAPPIIRKSKDIFRAGRLEQLPPDNPHVHRDLEKIKKGVPLSPVLLVRGDLMAGRSLTVADGYHRVCAVHHLDDEADIACRMVDLKPGKRPARR